LRASIIAPCRFAANGGCEVESESYDETIEDNDRNAIGLLAGGYR
jgi:hypothetical protein